MALADAVQGGKRPSQTITWSDQDGTALDLTGATITARITRPGGEAIAADGTFTLTDAENGQFRWDYGTNDVGTAGTFDVQFNAAFGSGTTPARTVPTRWKVHKAI